MEFNDLAALPSQMRSVVLHRLWEAWNQSSCPVILLRFWNLYWPAFPRSLRLCTQVKPKPLSLSHYLSE